METLLVILLVIALFGNWLWFVAFRAYRSEMSKQIRKRGMDQYSDKIELEQQARANALYEAADLISVDPENARNILIVRRNEILSLMNERKNKMGVGNGKSS